MNEPFIINDSLVVRMVNEGVEFVEKSTISDFSEVLMNRDMYYIEYKMKNIKDVDIS